MEKAKFESQFKQTDDKLEKIKIEANEFLNKEVLNEKDKLRLTRILQLIERYSPERQIKDEKDHWRTFLETMHRFLPKGRKKEEVVDKISERSYLLAEEAVETLRKLRSINFKLDKEADFSEDRILNQERPQEVVKEETLDTSITLEYEKKHWGVERICLDGIQNHLPADSKGERVWVRCLVDNEWVSLDEAKQQSEKIKGVQFIDDGVGFDVKNLSLLYSTKAEEEGSAGQFGEGMKMMAAAALRENLEPELESQNWQAKPIPKEVSLTDTRNKTEKKIQQLSFDVQHLSGEPMIGSRTTFRKPSQEFIDEVVQVDKKVLALRENYRPIFVTEEGQIVDKESGNIFVKGIFVTKQETLLSYNFDDVETNRDRNRIVSGNIEDRVRKIIEQLFDRRLAKTLLKKSVLEPKAIECNFYNITPQHPEIWKNAFYEAFGEDATLNTGFKIPEVFKDKPVNRVDIPSGMKNLLLQVGVATDREAIPDFFEETIPTSLTLEYGKDVWKEERILLDATQNHLPQDSGGSWLELRFKTKDGEWYPFEKMSDFPNDQIETLKIADNGEGYNYKLLEFLYSTKGDASSGKFGEGLKMLCVAALRKNIDISLSSRNWVAKPKVNQQEIDSKQVDQLVFDVVNYVKKDGVDDEDSRRRYEQSTTSFENLTPEMIDEFRSINKKVLAVEGAKPIEKTNEGQVLALEGGMIYVREILVPGDHNLLYTYHFPQLEIKDRDRTFISDDELGSSMKQIWSNIDNEAIIKDFLFKANLEAQKGGAKSKVEFATDFAPKDPEKWKKIFQESFGKDVAIRDVHSQDFDAMQQNLHVGLELISFPPAVYKMLSQNLDLPTYHERVQEMTDVEHIEDENLTSEEKQVIEILKMADDFMPGNRQSDVKVYIAKKENQKLADGFSDQVDIHLHRPLLNLERMIRAMDVYWHEKAHHNTGGAQDASEGFRNYLSMALAKLTLKQLEELKPELVKN